ncbi:MAG: PD40 domain-containing protein [Alphaproteobacteria bacterium]|nr:PD40 domain-containing protein [Alphaproteobacteria bacterium]
MKRSILALVGVCAVAFPIYSLGLLAKDGALDNGGTFSPDGKALLFHSFREGKGEIWEMDLTTLAQKKITAGDNNDRWPDVSPDGQKVSFISTRDANWEVYIIGRDGTGLKRLTDNYVLNLGATWGPDNVSLAYAEHRDGEGVSDIFITNIDNGKRTRIAENGLWPDWSPDGRSIIFIRPESDETINVIRYDVKEGTEQQITQGLGMVTSPRWAADSQHIYFVAPNRAGSQTIHRMAADGTGVTDIGAAAKMDSMPTESPDGATFVYGWNKEGNDDLYLRNLKTGDTENLTGQ